MGSVEPLPTIGANNGEDPQPGLWKVRLRKDAPVVLMQIWLVDAIDGGDAVGYWRDGLTLAGQIAGKPAGSQDIIDRWLFGEPATKAEAAHWGQHGRWPSDAPPLPPRTHNAPVDPFEALQLEADERVEQAQRWLHEHSPIGDQVACDMARNIQAELLAVAKRADAMHEVEKRPHLEAGRKVDAKYGFRAALADWAAKLRGAFEGWMAAEERRQREAAEAKFREERAAAEAERRRIEAERARKLADDPAAALTDPEPELPALPVAPDPVKVQAGGGVGRRSGLKDDWDIEFTDYKLAALLVIEDPDIAIMVGKVLKRRVRAAKGKGDWPGIKVTRVRRAA
jgi:hypothetical protein